MPNNKTPQQQAENLSSFEIVADEIAEERANNLADEVDARTIQKFLQKMSDRNGEVGTKAQAMLSQLRMGMYSKIAEENAEAEAATIPDEEIERMKQRALSPQKVLRAIANQNSDNGGDDDTQVRLLMGGQ
ncbi:MAG: hypothetical protein WBA77_11845 [Microcoleaceae cyanobacterium]